MILNNWRLAIWTLRPAAVGVEERLLLRRFLNSSQSGVQSLEPWTTAFLAHVLSGLLPCSDVIRMQQFCSKFFLQIFINAARQTIVDPDLILFEQQMLSNKNDKHFSSSCTEDATDVTKANYFDFLQLPHTRVPT